MYQKPPFISDAQIASVAGTASVTIIAAPGAGLRIRVVGGQIGVNRASAGTSDVQISAVSPGIMARNFGLAGALGGTNTLSLDIPEPGITAGDNEAITLSIISSVAGLTGIGVLYYYIDDIS